MQCSLCAVICFSLFAVVMTPRGGGPLGAGGSSLFVVVRLA